ncbi:MAG: LysM peptidoglycan-binding domain-containing protein, partial [Candidatus Marinimicrobia bacterium]|nr:LysM peptidoglycan-binding domain-containing protein [Candidatus Neomarinimicrobiota bacterium]
QVLFPKKKDTLLINLLPDYVLRRQKTFKLAWHGLLLLLLIFLVPFAINWLYVEKNATHRDALQKITHLEKSINDIEWVTYMVDSLSLAHSVAQENLINLTKFSKGSLRWSVTLRQLFIAMEEVDGLWIAELKSKGVGIELAGLSLYRNRIPRFIEYFEDAEIKSVVPDDIRGRTVYKFLISINSIVPDSLAFDPKIIIPPHRPEASPESSSPIIIIDEERITPALDTLSVDSVSVIPDSSEVPDSSGVADSLFFTEGDLDTLAADSFVTTDAIDTLQITAPDSTRALDSLDRSEADTPETILQDTVMFDPEEEPSVESEIPEFALLVHRVESDESLRGIAQTLLGSADRWSEIYNLNLDILSDPLSLEPGQTLIVLLDEPEQESITHIIQSGENLKRLARRYYGDGGRWKKLYQLNKAVISNPNKIFPGQKLTIITAEQRYQFPMQIHTIRSGESLKRIARRYLGDAERWEEVYKLNQDVIKYANIIYAGQRIRVMNETGEKNAAPE